MNTETLIEQDAGGIVERFQKRILKELIAAWRAGYGYVHIYEPVDNTHQPGSYVYRAVADLNSAPLYGVEDFKHTETYQLDVLSQDVIREAGVLQNPDNQ